MTMTQDPNVVNVLEWKWIKVATSIKKIYLYRKPTSVYYYKTYRLSGEDAPIDPEIGDLPDEAIRIFDLSSEEVISSDTPIDIYILCGNNDDDDDDAGQIVVSTTENTIDTVKQSNISPWNDFYFVQANGAPTTLTVAVPTAGDTRILSVASVANISVGDWIGLFSGAPGEQERYYWASVESINVLDLTMDTLIDFTFAIGSVVLSTTKNMAVDGSITPQVFAIQAGGGAGDLSIDISRVMLGLLCTDTVDLSKFGDIVGGLTRPMYLRVKENGVYRNKLSVKNNFDLALFAFDWNPFSTINPQQGQNGFLWRFSIGGEDKHDAVSRVSGGNIGSLEWIVQSDLTTQITIESVGANSEVTP